MVGCLCTFCRSVVKLCVFNEATMSSVENLRDFVNERITAAAEEIFGVFNRIIVEYEQEIERQRRLLEIVWKPDIKLHRIEPPQKHVCTEEKGVSTDQQLYNQERSSSLDQEDPDAQIKEEEEELCTSQEEEQLVLKQETDTPAYGKSGHNGVKTLYSHPDKSQNSAQTEPPALCISWVKEESDHENTECQNQNSDKEVLSVSSQEAESQDQREDKHGDSGLTEITEPKKRRCQRKSHSKKIYDCSLSDINSISYNDKKSFKCDSCPQEFKFKSGLQRHQRRHTGEKPFSCNSCGRRFSRKSELTIHLRIHTGEKPYSCDTCKLSFCRKSELTIHMRIHTGEKPYSCKTCQKDFRFASELKVHLRNHTGEKPHVCEICGDKFSVRSLLKRHLRGHTGEKLHSCKTCGRDFQFAHDLKTHIRVHTGEKPFLCKTCGRYFRCTSALSVHMRRHAKKKLKGVGEVFDLAVTEQST